MKVELWLYAMIGMASASALGPRKAQYDDSVDYSDDYSKDDDYPKDDYKPEPDYSPEPSYAPEPDYSPEPSYAPEPDYEPAPPSYSPEPDYEPAPPSYSPEPDYEPAPSYSPEPDYEPEPSYTPEPDYEPAPYKPEPPKDDYKPAPYKPEPAPYKPEPYKPEPYKPEPYKPEPDYKDAYSPDYPTKDEYGSEYPKDKYPKTWKPKTHHPEFFSLKVDEKCDKSASYTTSSDCQFDGFAIRLEKGIVIATPYNKWWDPKLPIFFVDDDTEAYTVSKKPLQLYIDTVTGALRYAPVGWLPPNSIAISFYKIGNNPLGKVGPSPAYFAWPSTEGRTNLNDVGTWWLCPLSGTGQYQVFISDVNFGKSKQGGVWKDKCVKQSLAAINANPWKQSGY